MLWVPVTFREEPQGPEYDAVPIHPVVPIRVLELSYTLNLLGLSNALQVTVIAYPLGAVPRSRLIVWIVKSFPL
jgi:hypothetical protein